MTESNPDGRLFEWYRHYIGEPDREIDVYLGFGLFFGGIGLGLAAFVIAASGQLLGIEGYTARKAAFAAGMIALPTTLSSVIVLLPVSRRAVFGGAVGSLICLVGLAGFLYAYPFNWATGTGPQYSVQVMFVYGLGLAALLAATGGALVAYHIDRAMPGPADIEGVEDDAGDDISDEQIEQDIEDAMKNVDLTWGGVERHEGTDLKITNEESDLDISGMDVEVDRVHRSAVDDQVHSLQTIKGGNKDTARSRSTVDDQMNQLQELRKRQQEESEKGEQSTVLDRLLERIAGIVGRR